MRITYTASALALALAAVVGCTGDVDSDGDGLSDAKELELGTSPHEMDTDHDGVHDGQEYQDGTDPRDPNDCRRHDGHGQDGWAGAAGTGDGWGGAHFGGFGDGSHGQDWGEALPDHEVPGAPEGVDRSGVWDGNDGDGLHPEHEGPQGQLDSND